MPLAIKCVISVLILNFLCFFIQASFNIVATGVATQPAGYDIYIDDADGNPEFQYKHLYTDGEDKKLEALDKAGTEYSRVDFRTPLGKGARFFINALTMVFTISIFCGFVYSFLWKAGDTDNNKATFGVAERDKLKGLKVGLIASVPFALLWMLLVINKFATFAPWLYGIFKAANYYLYPLVNWAYGSAMTVSEISIVGLLILLLTMVPIPLAAGLGYYFGNSEISLKNKLLYVKEKK